MSDSINSHATGPNGPNGPNDFAYAHANIVLAATCLKRAQEFSVGYGHSKNVIAADDPFRIAMNELSKLDEIYCQYANKSPNPEHFSTFEPIS